jgi:hypothetical protein
MQAHMLAWAALPGALRLAHDQQSLRHGNAKCEAAHAHQLDRSATFRMPKMEPAMLRVAKTLIPAVFALAVAVSTTAWAGPAMSEWSGHSDDYDQDICVPRAQGVFAADGWQAIQPTGYVIMADRGPLSGMIVCLDYGGSLTQSVAIVVVSGGDGNAAADAA